MKGLGEEVKNEIVVYQPNDMVRLDVRLENETVWLTQAQLCVLFQRDVSVISRHIKNIFAKRELDKESNLHFLQIANADRPVAFYSLDVIISVGYCVKSIVGTRFRQWATQIIKERMLAGAVQAVKEAIQTTYSQTGVRADGQVIKVLFSDRMKFEVLPAFASTDWYGKTTYSYPDSNMDGNWKSTNPKAEQSAMKDKNTSSRGLLFDTCKYMRYVRDEYYSSYHLSGIVIDSFVYLAMSDWCWTDNSTANTVSDGRFEQALYDYYINYCRFATTIQAPGSYDYVSLSNSKECLEKVLYKMM
ncbi:MAG: virulence RhuM family protein [Kiritimatiellae bacterium]|nr:virulence RhuM family protein [Kiritimatiellia bacterium]